MVHPMPRLLREPLVHFLAAGALLFALYELAVDGTPPAADLRDTIVVSTEQQQRLGNAFQRIWLRQPTKEELAGLIDDHVRQEVLYREALRLGLDRDDAVVRRRMGQKMAFLSSSGAELLEPEDADLRAHLSAHADRYRRPGQVTFRQIYLGETPSREEIESARVAATGLPHGAEPLAIGKPTLLPRTVGPALEPAVRSQFGPEFAGALFTLTPGGWHGPLRSGYGWHLVHVKALAPGYVPGLDEIRDELTRDWRSARAAEVRERQYQALRAGYRVHIQDQGE
jgi:hypothetical protein